MADKEANSEEDEVFWADRLAESIISRNKFHYLDKKVEQPKEFVVKTSASISGVLHIGRLSDTIRGFTVYRALKDQGVKARIIWVAEDMDPLRKIPEGVPKEFEKYLGMPVTDIPDPKGCHQTYAAHHIAEYFQSLDNFVFTKLEKFSMREEYLKGSFNQMIKALLENEEQVREIQNRYRTNPLKKGWSPWSPICEKCGKVATPKVTEFKDGKIHYVCKDYYFETTMAAGCNFHGEADPFSGNGKLMWKSEWAAQWLRWNICTEGAGKEYQVPNSAFWINAEIAEKVLSYPMPQPIFYEHLMIDGVKMSASLGNVIYPKDWLEVARPELLCYFYNKRLMKTRNFSWKDLPNLYEDYDHCARIYAGSEKLDNEKELQHMKRLFVLSHKQDEVSEPLEMSFSHAVLLSQVFQEEQEIIASLKKTGHYQPELHAEIKDRLAKALFWVKHHAPDEYKIEVQHSIPKDIVLSDKQKEALRQIVKAVKEKEWDEKSLHNEFYEIAKKLDMPPAELFKAGYRVLLNKERGPKLAHFMLALGDRSIKILEKV